MCELCAQTMIFPLSSPSSSSSCCIVSNNAGVLLRVEDDFAILVDRLQTFLEQIVQHGENLQFLLLIQTECNRLPISLWLWFEGQKIGVTGPGRLQCFNVASPLEKLHHLMD